MPTYHLDIQDGPTDQAHTVVDFNDLAEARCQALKLAGAAIQDTLGTFWDNPEWMLTVTDDGGETLFQLQVLGKEGPAAQNLSRVGVGEGTYDNNKSADANDIGVDGC